MGVGVRGETYECVYSFVCWWFRGLSSTLTRMTRPFGPFAWDGHGVARNAWQERLGCKGMA